MINIEKNKEVKYIEIVFENLESIVLGIGRIDNLCMTGIQAYLFHQNHLTLNLENTISYSCSYVSFDIAYNNKNDLEYKPADGEVLGMYVGNETENNVEKRQEVLGRILQHNDISQIDFLDGELEEIVSIAVPWGEDEYTNELMEYKVNKEKKIITLSIDEKKGLFR